MRAQLRAIMADVGPTDQVTPAAAVAKLRRDYDEMLANLTATQARCTELLQELRELKRRTQEHV